MDLGDKSQNSSATVGCNFVRPAKPWVYVWITGVSSFVFWLEIHVYDNASFLQFLLSIPFFAFFIYMMLVAFFAAARLEIDGESVRRSLFGRNLVRIPWKNATVIQGLFVRRQWGGLAFGYRVLTEKNFLVFGQVSFGDENECLAEKLNLIAKRFGIPLEQGPDQFAKFQRVDEIRFK